MVCNDLGLFAHQSTLLIISRLLLNSFLDSCVAIYRLSFNDVATMRAIDCDEVHSWTHMKVFLDLVTMMCWPTRMVDTERRSMSCVCVCWGGEGVWVIKWTRSHKHNYVASSEKALQLCHILWLPLHANCNNIHQTTPEICQLPRPSNHNISLTIK